MKKSTFAFGLLLLIPTALDAAEQLIGAGGAYWSGGLAASTTTACIKASSAAGAKCALFHASDSTEKRWTVATLTATADTICCWGLVPNADIDTTNNEYTTGDKGPCFTVPVAPVVLSQKPYYPDLLASSAGAVTGICTNPVTTHDNGKAGDGTAADSNAPVYAPCAEGGGGTDCNTNHGVAAACTAAASLTTTQRNNIGVYINCETPSGTSVVRAGKDRVLRFY